MMLLSTGSLQQIPGLNPEELAALVRKEQLNSYGIMAAPGLDGERRVKGSGLYQQCALINHECNPNTARCDHFDGMSVRMTLRAMHDLPPGDTLTASMTFLGKHVALALYML
jgi:SET and MYND domain-containing protein